MPTTRDWLERTLRRSASNVRISFANGSELQTVDGVDVIRGVGNAEPYIKIPEVISAEFSGTVKVDTISDTYQDFLRRLATCDYLDELNCAWQCLESFDFNEENEHQEMSFDELMGFGGDSG